MKLKDLQDAMIAAMKAKDKARKDSISALVSAVKKAGIDAGCRDDIPEDMVSQVILKELKSVKEQIDTCPASREDLLAEYKARYEVMSEFAPKLLSAEEVKENATNILEKLGLNMSTYINMALNQLIIQEGIPFAVKLAKSSYTDEEKIKEVAATLRMEGLKLSDSDLSMLQEIKSGNMSIDDARAKILSEV